MTDRSKADVSRRSFTAGTLVTGAVAATLTGTAAKAALPVTSSDVQIKTADGTAEAFFVRPSSGKHPGVIVWTDIFGLRPYFKEFATRIAGDGYAVLVPHPFYRNAPAPVVADARQFNFADPASRTLTAKWTAPINQPGAIEHDAAAYVAFLDAQKEVDTKKKIGTQGYCMGGPLALRTAASQPERIGAAATFHGGGMVTDLPTSPHLLAPKIKARLYIAIAASDDTAQPDAKDKLKAAFAAAGVPAEVVVYTGMAHGWTVHDMPNKPDGSPIYNPAEAERAYGKLMELYKAAL